MKFPTWPGRTTVLALAIGASLVALAPRAEVRVAGVVRPPSSQDQGQLPVFRGGTNLVLVDAYPRKKDGGIFEGLKPVDFEVREDGVLQKVEQFEFVKVEPALEPDRRDPNGVDEMRRDAADPHNRVFVIYLDTPHVERFSAISSREPLLELLDKLIGPNDLFGLMTWKVPITALTFGRKSYVFQDQIRHWLGKEGDLIFNDPDDKFEDFLDACFGDAAVGLKLKRRETRALQNLTDLVTYLSLMREARTTLIVVSGGWWQQTPSSPSGRARTPQITSRGGRLGIDQPDGPNATSSAACAKAQAEIVSRDNVQIYRDLITLAERRNVVFYPIDPCGLRASGDICPPNRNRLDSLLTLAENTGGIPIVNTNDLMAGARRIITDVSSYYLLGYYSTNAKKDGTLRKINVRVKPSGLTVVARRSYVAENAAEIARAMEAARKATPAGPPPEVAEGMKSAMLPIARLDSSATDVLVTAVAGRADLIVVAEVSVSQMATAGGPWTRGVGVEATATSGAGEKIGTVTATIAAGTRSALLRIPLATATGPFHVTITSRGQGATSTEQVTVPAVEKDVIGAPLLFRGMPSVQVALTPVADLLFRRTERAHIEWPALRTIDHREARMLDRRGQVMPVSIALTERDCADGPSVIADVPLASFSPGDYAIEVTATAGDTTTRRYIALRVTR